MDHDEDIWLVQLSQGAVRAMTLDELDAAFQEGAIDEETFVRRDGAAKWSRLRDELGDPEPAAAPAPPPTPTPSPVSYGAMPQYQPYQTMRPVVSVIDTGEFEDAPFAKKSRKGLFVGIAVAAAAVAFAAFGVTKLKNVPAADVNASVVQAAPPQVVTPPPPDPQPTAAKPTLSDDQKKALSDKDNQLNQKMDQKRKDRANKAANQPTRGHTQPPPFHKGGNAYDPLNAKL